MHADTDFFIHELRKNERMGPIAVDFTFKNTCTHGILKNVARMLSGILLSITCNNINVI